MEAGDAWINARDKYKNRLNNLARQLATGQMNTDVRGFERHFNYVYNLYHPYAKKYLEALRLYAQEPPELKGRLMQDYLQEASLAQKSTILLIHVLDLCIHSAKISSSDSADSTGSITLYLEVDVKV